MSPICSIKSLDAVTTTELVRASANPDATVLEFLQSTYEAAATLGSWDRAALERAG